MVVPSLLKAREGYRKSPSPFKKRTDHQIPTNDDINEDNLLFGEEVFEEALEQEALSAEQTSVEDITFIPETKKGIKISKGGDSSFPRRRVSSISLNTRNNKHSSTPYQDGSFASEPQTVDDVTKSMDPKRRKKFFQIPPSHIPGENYYETILSLQTLYKTRIKELEEKYLFSRFGYDELTDQQLEAKAQVLLLGQYSTGKTTMIRYLLNRQYQGLHIGPEPTTDRFVAIVYGEKDDIIQGKVLTENPSLPFKETESFAGLAGKFQASRCPAEVLKYLTLIDTPGVLSGEKQKTREYDFRQVTQWFAMRSDLILLLFDPSKLDISDEFKQVIADLKTSSSKVRIVLNKADTLERSALTRVYGALMWAMGKILETPEVVRVYFGSFWEKTLKYTDPLFIDDEASLLKELENLPQNVPKQRVNHLADRVSVLKFYLHLMVAIRQRLSFLPFKALQDWKEQQIMASLPSVVDEVLLKLKRKIAHKDIPRLDVIRDHLLSFNSLQDLPKPTIADLKKIDMILEQDIPNLIAEVDGSQNRHSQSSSRSDNDDNNVTKESFRNTTALYKKKGGSSGGALTKNDQKTLMKWHTAILMILTVFSLAVVVLVLARAVDIHSLQNLLGIF